MEKTTVTGYLPYNLTLEEITAACDNWNTLIDQENKIECKLKPELILLFFKYLMCKALYKREHQSPLAVLDEVQIHHTHLKKLFGEKLSANYIKLMKKHGWIYYSAHNAEAKLSREYRINYQIVHVNLLGESKLYSQVKITGKKAINAETKFKEFVRNEIISKMPEEFKFLVHMLHQLRLDLTSKKAQNLIEQLRLTDITFGKSEYTYYDYLCNVNNRDIEYFFIDKFGMRLHSCWQTIKKEMRELLYFEDYPNEKLKVIDIVNSQPWLSSCIDANIILKLFPNATELAAKVDKLCNVDGNVPRSLNRFRELCCTGKIYEEWQDILRTSLGEKWQLVIADNIRLKTRKNDKRDSLYDAKQIETLQPRSAAKICFYRVIFGTQSEHEILSNIFKLHFPDVWNIFKVCKEYPLYGNPSGARVYTNLSCIMQRLESDLVLSKISSKLKEAGVDRFLTIHDAVAVPEQYSKLAEEVMVTAIRESGLPVPCLIKAEPYNGLFSDDTPTTTDKYNGWAFFSYEYKSRVSPFYSSKTKLLTTPFKNSNNYIEQYADNKLVAIYTYTGELLSKAIDFSLSTSKPREKPTKGRIFLQLPERHSIRHDLKKIKYWDYDGKIKEWSFPVIYEASIRNLLERNGLSLNTVIKYKKGKKERKTKAKEGI
ncbi:MAG: hypothetical protein EOO46_10015, partial [Flavobacterium sp.]